MEVEYGLLSVFVERSSMGQLIRPFFLLLSFLTLAGCSVLGPGFPDERIVRERVLLPDIPFYAQEDYQCGPAALAMLLAWNGEALLLPALTGQVYSPSLEGSLQPAIVAAARRYGYLVYPLDQPEALFGELAAGHPVLVLQNLGLTRMPRWHYAVVIGHDPEQKRIFLHSGRREAMGMSARLFGRTWARAGHWAVVVLPPERLPATAGESSFLAAAVGLEQAGQWSAALLAYQAALERWPDSFGARVGLGNVRYTLADYEGAQRAFRQALLLQPANGAVMNNLALALAAAGYRQEALVVIGQGLELDETWRQELLRTRQKIVADQPWAEGGNEQN
ncbi:MAG TPA: bacteriocin-processing peptidase family protein [Desulfurivibrio alkaliphilus]|uniref:Bacteriocin-processing peptidase family protein n=1 Tax=Desulfurivibrio alkaliphilus TaxID=427923 RepID=A0A7C2TLV9_9BACT|nr:bacteriocin-processing peptidase family protein [Desulfurivibrio alkaliphilus]